jgi:putative transport protein
MWSWFVDMLRNHPEMAVVLTLGFGYAIGKLRLGTVARGAVVGVLIAGAIIGQIGVKPASDLKTLFFLLFLFSIGYRTGPQFFSGLRSSGFPQIALIVPQLITLLVGRFVFRMHPGILLGVCSGAGTSAPSLAAVQEVARSKVPTLGSGVTYTIGNVLLALWGSVIVALTHVS